MTPKEWEKYKEKAALEAGVSKNCEIEIERVKQSESNFSSENKKYRTLVKVMSGRSLWIASMLPSA